MYSGEKITVVVGSSRLVYRFGLIINIANDRSSDKMLKAFRVDNVAFLYNS